MSNLNLNLDIKFCDCSVKVTDITGFKSQLNPYGFVKEGDAINTSNEYHLSDGVFIDVAYKLDYDSFCTILFSETVPYFIPSEDVKDEYSENVNVASHHLKYDGEIFIDKYFIMNKEFYESVRVVEGYFNKEYPIVYYDINTGDIHRVTNGFEDIIPNTADFITYLREEGELVQGVMINSTNFFNLCNLKACYNKALTEKLDTLFGYDNRKGSRKCPNGDCGKVQNEDNLNLIKLLLSAIEYAVSCGEFMDAERLMRLINGCCDSICKDYSNDCGCS